MMSNNAAAMRLRVVSDLSSDGDCVTSSTLCSRRKLKLFFVLAINIAPALTRTKYSGRERGQPNIFTTSSLHFTSSNQMTCFVSGGFAPEFSLVLQY